MSKVIDVADIFDFFNIEEIASLVKTQIDSDENTDAFGKRSDYFKPLYTRYKEIVENVENTNEIKQEAENRFMGICDLILYLICKKYGIVIAPDWKFDHYHDIPGLTMAFYSMFVLEISTNLFDVCRNFLITHTKTVFNAFEDHKIKKDAMTVVSKKEMTIEVAVILSNIYDITTWILGQLSEEDFFILLPQDYTPLTIIRGLYEQGSVSGSFMDIMNDIYATNVPLKGNVCFRLIADIKNGNMDLTVKDK